MDCFLIGENRCPIGGKYSRNPAVRRRSDRNPSQEFFAMAEKQNQYEAMFLISPTAAPDADAGVKLAQGIVERHGGKMIVIKKWDERKLAYEIRGQKRGMYVIAFFNAPGKAVTGIEREVNLSEDVLRVL